MSKPIIANNSNTHAHLAFWSTIAVTSDMPQHNWGNSRFYIGSSTPVNTREHCCNTKLFLQLSSTWHLIRLYVARRKSGGAVKESDTVPKRPWQSDADWVVNGVKHWSRFHFETGFVGFPCHSQNGLRMGVYCFLSASICDSWLVLVTVIR